MNLEADLFMERLRRQADRLSRDELLILVHQLTHAYTTQKSATDWALRYGGTDRDRFAKPDPPSSLG
jgi:hypothetical protein